MPREKQAIARFEFSSRSDRNKLYDTLLYSDGSTSCNCRGWTFKRHAASKRECKHTDEVDRRAGAIVRGERHAEHWGGRTLIDVTQAFISPEQYREAQDIEARATAVAREATEVIATFSHAADYNRGVRFQVELYSDGTTHCECEGLDNRPNTHTCYLANRAQNVYGPKILRGEARAEKWDGRTVQRPPVYQPLGGIQPPSFQDTLERARAAEKRRGSPIRQRREEPRPEPVDTEPPKRRYNL
jgi:hypothetical protein